MRRIQRGEETEGGEVDEDEEVDEDVECIKDLKNVEDVKYLEVENDDNYSKKCIQIKKGTKRKLGPGASVIGK